jgi:hypothetical protein
MWSLIKKLCCFSSVWELWTTSALISTLGNQKIEKRRKNIWIKDEHVQLSELAIPIVNIYVHMKFTCQSMYLDLYIILPKKKKDLDINKYIMCILLFYVWVTILTSLLSNSTLRVFKMTGKTFCNQTLYNQFGNIFLWDW